MKCSLLLCLFLLPWVVKGASITVNSPAGVFVGEQVTSGGSKTVNRFLGIPYAQPPIGDLRFSAPQPLKRLSAPFRATKWPPKCVQNSNIALNVRWARMYLNNDTSEDCLFLNVWSPSVDGSLPVLVFIHGGGMYSGSSSTLWYDSAWLSIAVNAVIITLNYRVGLLGYLHAANSADVPGNQGLRDQIAALEWVQQNVESFGGNPEQVTIWGQSAGSWSVSAHILMPKSRELFQNAIMMSGAALVVNSINTPQFYFTELAHGLRDVGCLSPDERNITPQTIECLRALKPEVVDEIVYGLPIMKYSKLPLFVIDGELIPESPKFMFERGDFKRDVNLLISTVEDEGSFFMDSFGGPYAANDPTDLGALQARQFVREYAENVYPTQDYPTRLVDYFYFSGMNHSTLHNSDHIRGIVARALGDGQLGCPTIEFGRRVALHGAHSPDSPDGGAHVYQMHYAVNVGAQKILCAHWARACHCDDLYPAFGMPFRFFNQHTDRERDISREYSRIIASFIRTGKPRNDREWAPFLVVDRDKVVAPVLKLTDTSTGQPEDYDINFGHDKCSLVWNKFLSD